jgi:hypothetical protein
MCVWVFFYVYVILVFLQTAVYVHHIFVIICICQRISMCKKRSCSWLGVCVYLGTLLNALEKTNPVDIRELSCCARKFVLSLCVHHVVVVKAWYAHLTENPSNGHDRSLLMMARPSPNYCNGLITSNVWPWHMLSAVLGTFSLAAWICLRRSSQRKHIPKSSEWWWGFLNYVGIPFTRIFQVVDDHDLA